MTAARFNESVLEDTALAWLERFGYAVKQCTEIAPGELPAERAHYGQAVVADRE